MGFPDELAGYAHARLAIAYALVGRSENAANILAELTTRDIYSPRLISFIETVESRLRDPIQMCLAAYESFTFNCALGDTCIGSPIKATVGETLENSGYGVNSPWSNYPKPSLAGCDIEALIESIVDGLSFDIHESPAAQLEAAGLSVSQTQQLDLNEDGSAEWLVWFSFHLKPMFFVVEGDRFHISGPDVDYPDEYTSFHSLTLPGNVEIALAQIYFDDQTPSEERWRDISIVTGGPVAECTDQEGNSNDLPYYAKGFVKLWRFENNELAFIQDEILCQARTFEELFSDGSLYVWRDRLNEEDVFVLVPDVLQWNIEQERYISPEEEVAASPNIEQPVELYNVREDFEDQQYQELVDLSEASFSYYSEQELMVFRYYRALALEALDRPDEALAEYVAIYESVPESAWGMLAALHFERGE
jgi:hypothetical protein